MKSLEDAILVKSGGHLDSGMHGTYFMLRWLMQADRNDLIYEMASRKTYPSWGYMLEQGATTTWENWSGGSHTHDTLISIGGIRFDKKSPGFKHFFIRPGVVGDLKYARTRYKSIHGEIVSDWRIEHDRLHLGVTVPAGTTATVLMPGGPADSKDARFRGIENGRAAFEVESGRHEFASKLTPN